MWQAGCLGIHLNLSQGFPRGKNLLCESAEQFARLHVSLSAPLMTRHVPEAVGTVCDVALTRAPFANQAIFVSKGNGAQAGILNFESQKVMPAYSMRVSNRNEDCSPSHLSPQFNPKFYTFEQHPHRPGIPLRVASISESDSGIQFVTGDSLGELFRWLFDGSAVSIEAIQLANPDSTSFYQDQRLFTALMWAADVQKLWAGMAVNESNSGEPTDILTQWDISNGSGELTGSRKVHAPILNVHQVSEYVVLAEVG